MASIVPRNIGSIDYLAYGSIFTGAMFLPKKKVMFIFPPEKPQMSAGGWCPRPQLFEVAKSIYAPGNDRDSLGDASVYSWEGIWFECFYSAPKISP